jgi:hypothetical protein
VEEISVHHELAHDLELKKLLHDLALCEGRSVNVYSVKSTHGDPSGVGSLEDCRIHTTEGMAVYWKCRVGEFLDYLRNYQLL